jgi:hypothetical protein
LKGRAGPQGGVAAAFLAALTAVFAAVIIFMLFSSGIRRGMDHVMTFTNPQNEQTAIAIAISEAVYGLDSYVGYASVRDELAKVINRGTDGAGDPKVLPNLANRDLINEAIAKATTLGEQPEGFVADRSLITMVYDDVGFVDYSKIAFALFGYRIEALYYLFFTVLSLSAAIFLVQYWKSPTAQAVLLCSLLAFYLELDTEIFNAYMPTFWGLRHCSTLALVPMWHLMLLLVQRVRLSPQAIVLSVIQIAILVLAIKTRGSTAWMVFFLASVTIFLAFRGWWQLPREDRSAARLVKLSARWPLVLVVLGLLGSKLYTDARLHLITARGIRPTSASFRRRRFSPDWAGTRRPGTTSPDMTRLWSI